MVAEDFKEGTQFKNIHTKQIWEVVAEGDDIYFVSIDYGDISDSLDEDNFIEI